MTLRDIAERCGLSTASISLVIQDSPRVSAGTKVRVRAAMEDMGYVYDRRAANLRSARTFGIGLILTDIHNPALADLAMAIEDGSAEAGCSVMMGYSRDDVAKQARTIKAMLEYRLDGIVLSPAHDTIPDDLAQLAKSRVPVVQVTRRVSGFASDYSGPNYVMAGSLLAQHLHDIGASSVAFFGGSAGVSGRDERIRGLRDRWRELGGVWRPELVIDTNALEGGGVLAVRQLLARDGSGEIPDAIVGYSDVVASGIMTELRANGIRPGIDVAVAGIDDGPSATHLHPTLTSVETRMTSVGLEAVRMLLTRIDEVDDDPRVKFVSSRLHVRNSTENWKSRNDDPDGKSR